MKKRATNEDYDSFGADTFFNLKLCRNTGRFEAEYMEQELCECKICNIHILQSEHKCNTSPHCVIEHFCSMAMFQCRNVVYKINLISCKIRRIVTIFWDKFPPQNTVQFRSRNW